MISTVMVKLQRLAHILEIRNASLNSFSGQWETNDKETERIRVMGEVLNFLINFKLS